MCCLKPDHANGLVVYHRGWVRLLIVLFIVLFIVALVPRAPVHAQSTQTIESDDPRVLQSGTWSTQTTAAASNGSYLYSGGAEDDILGLSFVGSAIEIIYISGPQFGTLAIEIDGTVVRTVITTTEKIEYTQSARVDYLSDEPHSLKVYAQEGGVIAVDAFRIIPIVPITPVIPASTVGDGPVPSQNIPTNDGGISSGPFCQSPDTTQLISSAFAATTPSNGDSRVNDVSADGRYVVFYSDGTNLDSVTDTNAANDAFLRDRVTCTTTLISRVTGVNGTIGNAQSQNPSVSDDGRYVVFESIATNLVAGDTNAMQDVFMRDTALNNTTRIVMGTGGAEGNNHTRFPRISGDGRFVVFESSASNLVAGDTNAQLDVFVLDLTRNVITLESVATNGTQGNSFSWLGSISSDGRYVAFQSNASNLVPGDTNATQDIFLRDRLTGTTTRISVAAGGIEANGTSQFSAISGNGRYVSFGSSATNLVAGDTNATGDVFVYDRLLNTIARVSVGTGSVQSDGFSEAPTISDDGRYVSFASGGSNLVAGDTNFLVDIFVRDRVRNTTVRVSLTQSGVQANNAVVSFAFISGNGRYVVANSGATNLVPNDTNAEFDTFIFPYAPDYQETLALFNPTYNIMQTLNTLADNPAASAYLVHSLTPPVTTGSWVMGDWNGDNVDTPGLYASTGGFFYTNSSTPPFTWRGVWIGLLGRPAVAGRFNATFDNDCLGVIDSANFGPQGTAFAMYYTCDLLTAAPTLSFQWLSVLLPDAGGFSGPHQFASGDFNADGLDSIAVRRGSTIAYSNTPPTNSNATFPDAQFFGAPGTGDSYFLVGDWNTDGTDSFGLAYFNGQFYYRNDLQFNSGVYIIQNFNPFVLVGGTGLTAHTWH